MLDNKELESSLQSIHEMNAKQLEKLCIQIRSFLIDSVEHTGGHLASNLGIVELTLALHRVFDSSKDKIVWDVGHQCYVHKMLTGRLNEFSTLRQFDGISGFPRRSESNHDVFETGHSSTSISASLGLAFARTACKQTHHVVSVIGDGAMTGGMVYEALNQLGSSHEPMIIILNDNGMSISPNVGALSFHLNNLRSNRKYIGTKRSIAKRLPKVTRILEKIKNSIKYTILSSAFFEELGIKYIGPIDGHNLASLEKVLERVKEFEVPVLLHVLTKKGKGCTQAEQSPEKYHGISAKKPTSYETEKNTEKVISNSEVFGNTLCEMAEQDDKIVAITAAMPAGTGLQKFAEHFPKRFFDVGIAEQHACTLAAGMAAGGLKPVFAVYSTFLQRAYDQLLHDVCLQNLPVLIGVDRAGPVGEDGSTHHGVYDISFLSQMPYMSILSPATTQELEQMIPLALEKSSPCAIRYPRTKLPNDVITKKVRFGKWDYDGEFYPLIIIATGAMLPKAYAVKNNLEKHSINSCVINARFIKPLDHELLNKISNIAKLVVTLEDGVITGGMGEQILHYLDEDCCYQGLFRCFGLDVDKPLPHGNVEKLFDFAGLSVDRIEKNIMREWEYYADKDAIRCQITRT